MTATEETARKGARSTVSVMDKHVKPNEDLNSGVKIVQVSQDRMKVLLKGNDKMVLETETPAAIKASLKALSRSGISIVDHRNS